MAYGTVKVDNITFTNGGIDQTVTVSGIVQSISGNITATGTIQGQTIIGTSTVSGATVTGDVGVFTTVTGGSAGFTTVTGTTVTGTTANFVNGTFSTQVSGTTVRGTTVSGATVTGAIGQFTTLDVNGDVTITDKIIHGGDTNTAIRFPAADTVSVETAGSERARIDSSGRLLIGTSTFAQTNAYSTDQKISVAGGIGNGIQLQGYSADEYNIAIDFSKSRGASVGTNTIVENNDSLGNLLFNGYDGSDYKIAALIGAEVDGTPGANDMPGRLVFFTTADGGSSLTERMRITSAGAIGLSGANYGTSGQALISRGSADPPTWKSVSVDVQEFILSGTWTKPSEAKMVYVEVIGGGGGGGSGRKQAAPSTSDTFGAGGGAGGMSLRRWILASNLGSTVTVTVGAGGAGGAAVTTATTNGNSGVAGGNSSFGTLLIAAGGALGGLSTLFGAAGGEGKALSSNAVANTYLGAAGGGSGVSGAAAGGNSGYYGWEGPGGGGAGGGLRGSDGFQRGGGEGGGGFVYYENSQWNNSAFGGGGGTAGFGGTSAGGAGVFGTGDGGGGGGAGNTVSGFNGGAGGFPGGGGGGGGSTNTGASSGAGGNGADGFVRVYTYF